MAGAITVSYTLEPNKFDGRSHLFPSWVYDKLRYQSHPQQLEELRNGSVYALVANLGNNNPVAEFSAEYIHSCRQDEAAPAIGRLLIAQSASRILTDWQVQGDIWVPERPNLRIKLQDNLDVDLQQAYLLTLNEYAGALAALDISDRTER